MILFLLFLSDFLFLFLFFYFLFFFFLFFFFIFFFYFCFSPFSFIAKTTLLWVISTKNLGKMTRLK